MAACRSLNFDYQVFNKYLTLDYRLGGGASGQVYGPIEWNDMQLAIKEVTFQVDKVTDEFKKDLEAKKVLWTSLEHGHLTRIHLVDFKQLPKAMYIVMEFSATGSLYKTLRSLGSENKPPIGVVTEWAKQIADGMLYLHERKIVHRDLKSPNILLIEPVDACDSHTLMNLKIADFDDIKEHNNTIMMSTLKGTSAYAAPEVLKEQRFSKASDVWSFGVVIWEMLSGEIPYKNQSQMEMICKSIVGKLEKLQIKQSFPEDYKLLLERCWKTDHANRPSFNEIRYILREMANRRDVFEQEKEAKESAIFHDILREIVSKSNAPTKTAIWEEIAHAEAERPGDSGLSFPSSEMIQDADSKFRVTGAGKSTDFEPAVLDKYATTDYYIGRGSYGILYGPIPLHGSQLTIKQVMFEDGRVTVDFKKLMEENKVFWTSLEHKNLLRIHWVDLTRLPKAMFLVMDFAGGGSLYETMRLLDTGNKLPIDVVTDWAKQIADGMMYLHEKNIVHRDLKSSNILLMEPFDVRNFHTMVSLKIKDLDDIKVHDHTTTMSFAGTLAYMAPEVIQSQRFSKASDVWSYGVVTWEILSGDIPHKGLEQITIMMKSITGKLDTLPLEESFPEEYKLLLKGCWKSTHKKRPAFEEISRILQRMDKLPEKYQSDPLLIKTIRIKATPKENKSISGLTILDKELFVVCELRSDIEVFDSMKFKFTRRWNIKEIIDPKDIVSSNRNKCLYIFDHKDDVQSSEILSVDPNRKSIKKWSTGGHQGYGLSVTYESNVILSVFNKNKLIEYSPDGKMIREINLSEAGIRFPSHAIKLTNGHFVVSHGTSDGDLHRVCIVDTYGKLLKSFGGERGATIALMNRPVYLAVDETGFVMVVDRDNNRILLLDSNLKLNRETLWKEKNELLSPTRMLLDESSGRMLVADSKWKDEERILVFQLCL